jgi:hypothetical protein
MATAAQPPERKRALTADFDIGPSAILNYSRLSYTLWYALAEFVDNTTQSRENYKATIDPVHRSKFLCRVYVKGEPLNTCKIWLGGWTHHGSDDHICYYEGRQVSRDRDDATNDMLSVTTDGHQLGLEGLGFGSGFGGTWNRGDEERLLSAERAAELLWQRFIKRLSAD